MTGLEFNSRGIGLDYTPGCFVCGGNEELLSNIAAFVPDAATGRAIVALFGKGARLDLRPYEPEWIQVKVGVCDAHRNALMELHELTTKDGVINGDMIAAVRSGVWTPADKRP